MMTKQVVCYIRRELISDWKRKVITHSERAFVYGSRDERVFTKLQQGGVLWIVSPVFGRPPEVVARLNIEVVAPVGDPSLKIGETLEQRFAHWKNIAVGDPESVFFGHNNAGPAMMHTRFVNPTSRKEWRLLDTSPEWAGTYGSRFARPFEIVLDGSEPSHFDKLAAEARPIFISWKRRDFSQKFILSLAYALADQGFMPWLDLLALPGSISLGVAQRRPDELVRLLAYGYDRSQALLVVESEHYGQASAESDENWTEKEWKGGGVFSKSFLPNRFIFRPEAASPSAFIPADYPRLTGQTPEQAALELRRRLS